MPLLQRQSHSLNQFRNFYDSLSKPGCLRLIPSVTFSASFASQGCIPHSWEAFSTLFVSRGCCLAFMGDIISFSLVGVKVFLDRSDDQGNRSCQVVGRKCKAVGLVDAEGFDLFVEGVEDL